MSYDKYSYFIFLFIFTSFYSLIFLAPILAFLAERCPIAGFFSDIIYDSLHRICHQRADRSFSLFGHKLGVCARCFGIHTGIFLATLLYPFIRSLEARETPSKHLLIASMIPMAIDGGTQLIGLRESFNELRFATGFLFGFTLGFYLVPVFNELLSILLKKFKKI